MSHQWRVYACGVARGFSCCLSTVFPVSWTEVSVLAHQTFCWTVLLYWSGVVSDSQENRLSLLVTSEFIGSIVQNLHFSISVYVSMTYFGKFGFQWYLKSHFQVKLGDCFIFLSPLVNKEVQVDLWQSIIHSHNFTMLSQLYTCNNMQ